MGTLGNCFCIDWKVDITTRIGVRMSLSRAIRFSRMVQLTAPAILMAVAAAMAETTGAAKMPGIGDKLPDFTLQTLDKKSVNLKKLEEDGKVTVVMLRGWPGYQCPICTKQVADLVKHADEFKKADTKVVLIYPGPADALEAHADEFVKGKGLPEGFLFVTDPDYAVTNAYGLRWDAKGETAYPSTFVVGKDGAVVYSHVSKGHGDRAKTEDVVGALK